MLVTQQLSVLILLSHCVETWLFIAHTFPDPLTPTPFPRPPNTLSLPQVLGLVLFVVGIVVLIEGENWNDIIDNKTVPVSVLLIVVGLVIAIVGFLGCFGAMKQNTSMLLIVSILHLAV